MRRDHTITVERRRHRERQGRVIHDDPVVPRQQVEEGDVAAGVRGLDVNGHALAVLQRHIDTGERRLAVIEPVAVDVFPEPCRDRTRTDVGEGGTEVVFTGGDGDVDCVRRRQPIAVEGLGVIGWQGDVIDDDAVVTRQ